MAFGKMNNATTSSHPPVDREAILKQRMESMASSEKKIRFSHGELCDIPINLIDVNPINSGIFKINNIDRLAEHIDSDGFKSTVSVYDTNDGRYLLFSGERRYTAMKQLNKQTIPAIIYDLPSTEGEQVEQLLGANIDARVLSPMEYARAIDAYIEKVLKPKGIKQFWKPVCEFFGMSDSSAHKYYSLLKMDTKLQELCEYDEFPYSALAGFSLNKEEADVIYEYIMSQKPDQAAPEDTDGEGKIAFWLTRAEIVAYINALKGKTPTPAKPASPKKEKSTSIYTAIISVEKTLHNISAGKYEVEDKREAISQLEDLKDAIDRVIKTL